MKITIPDNSFFRRKNEIGKPRKTDFPFLRVDITRFFIDMIRVFYSRNQKFRIEGFKAKSIEQSGVLKIVGYE